MATTKQKTTTAPKKTVTSQVSTNSKQVDQLRGRVSQLVDELHILKNAVRELQERHVDLARKVLS